MILSNSLDKVGNRLIGQYPLGERGSPPGFGTATTVATFHEAGYMSQAERRNEQMLKNVKEGAFALAKTNEGDAISARGFPGPGHGNGLLNFRQGDWGGGN